MIKFLYEKQHQHMNDQTHFLLCDLPGDLDTCGLLLDL